jgi:hypothetical protein
MGNVDGKDEGIFRKFNIQRRDGGDLPGGKHDGCDYFVLDWRHDPFAVPAARAYAKACASKFPQLARDLRKRAAVEARRWRAAEAHARRGQGGR